MLKWRGTLYDTKLGMIERLFIEPSLFVYQRPWNNFVGLSWYSGNALHGVSHAVTAVSCIATRSRGTGDPYTVAQTNTSLRHNTHITHFVWASGSNVRN